MSRVRILLADGVGLGKTIQAGLLLTELIARRLAHRILLVTPSGPLLEQWDMEMSQRFGLRFDVIDRAKLEQVRRGSELGANPFDYLPLGLASIDFLKQERALEQLERATYDVVVIDEAHHCVDLGGAVADRDDSLRRRLAEVLARRCEALILATATPHDGNDRSFASLCELLDPSLVDGSGTLRGDRYKTHVVRRLKSHILDPQTGQPRFQDREVKPCPVAVSPDRHARFIELQKSLLALVAPELRRAFRARRCSDVLAFIALLKRSVSTVEACRVTLSAVADRLQRILSENVEQQENRRQRLRSLRDLQRRQERFGVLSADEEAEQQALEVEDLAQALAALQRETASAARHVSRYSQMVESLDHLVVLADAAQHEDPKLEQLLTEILAIRQAEPRANILVYTEYMDSQRAILAALKRAGVGEALSMNGEDDQAQRTKVTDRFRTEESLVLVSTDAAAEGLDLHQRCHHLIHLELPFNPNRLEQRNGRIDRFGQEHTPRVRYLFLCGTFEQRILLRLIAKYERQRKLLTFVPNTLGLTASTDATAERLLEGLVDEEDQLFQRQEVAFDLVSGQENDGADTATRELLEEIDRSLRGFERVASANSWLGSQGLNAEASLFVEAGQALGRAHPLVRRALDRVRHLTYSGGPASHDSRISAVAAHVPEPTLIYTFLGRVISRAGREFERLLAVQFAASGASLCLPDNDTWLRLADPAHAINARDVWKTHFEPWATDLQPGAESLAAGQLKPLAAQFIAQRRAELRRERLRQQEWLELRAQESIGDRGTLAVQTELFGKQTNSASAPQTAAWASRTDPAERLSGFATDTAQPAHLRHEANGVLTLYRQRQQDLDAQEAFQEPEVVPVGLLMVLPQDAVKGGRG